MTIFRKHVSHMQIVKRISNPRALVFPRLLHGTVFSLLCTLYSGLSSALLLNNSLYQPTSLIFIIQANFLPVEHYAVNLEYR
jgi:hypothetical protein